MSRALRLFAWTLPLVALLIAGSAFAQTLPGVSQEQMDSAFADLSALYGSPVVRIDQAKAICNQEQYMVECAEIGKKHGLYGEEREAQVDAVLSNLKESVVERMKACESAECLVEVATSLARDITRDDPALARRLELTAQKVEEKRVIVETARSVGVDIRECQALDPDTASVELLRACVRLAKSQEIQRFIPEEDRVKVERTENTTALKEALQSGELACGDGTIEGCGTFCLNPSAQAGEQGTAAIPPICRDIAARFFGQDGVAELERAHSVVRDHVEAVREYQREGYPGDGRYTYPGDEGERQGPRQATSSRRIVCPRVTTTSCPPGEYRQESRDEFGCFVQSECIPFNTRTQEEPLIVDRFICPAFPTVDSCAPGEERVISFTSPECGTYYSCKPTGREIPGLTFPYKFGSGRVVLSFEEARMYCYESGSGGATVRGDKGECGQAFGIAVPDIPPEKQCAQYGDGWRSVDESGNCFNETKTEYVTRSGVLWQCVDKPVYGCAGMTNPRPEPPSGQKEQVWNDKGLRSWIRADASASRLDALKQACRSVSSGANIWMPGAGDFSSNDFGMPDPAKCAKAAACTSSQSFNGSECVSGADPYRGDTTSCPGFAYSRWDGKGARYCQLNNTRSCQYFYPAYMTESNYSPSSCPTTSDTESVSGSCSSDLVALLGDGCHSMGSGWFNGGMTSYVLPGTKTVKSCSSDYVSGCSGSTPSGGTPQCSDGRDNDGDGATDYPTDSGCYGADDWDESYGETYRTTSVAGQKTQVWNTYGLQSQIREDADPGRIASLKQACANVKSSSNIWMGGAGSYTSPDFGMPDSAKCTKAAACTSNQYFDGSSCVSGGYTTPGPGTSSIKRCFYPNASKSGQYVGYTVWCEADYVNCHEGSPSGASISLSGVSLGAPSSCESGWTGSGSPNTLIGSECRSKTSQSTCSGVSGCYWYTGYSGGYCDSSGSATPSTSGSCSSELTGLLGSGCHNMGSAWFNGSMTSYVLPGSTVVRSCTSEYLSGCSGGGAVGGSCPSGQYWSGSGCVSSTDYAAQQLACTTAGGTWNSGGNYCQYGSTAGSCSSELTGLLGSGCHNMGSAWFNSGMTSYVLPGESVVRSCASSYISGCTGGSTGGSSCPSGQYWNGSACVATSPTDCPSGWVWSGSSCIAAIVPPSGGCASGQYWDGVSCVPTSSAPPSCPSGQYWSGSVCTPSQTSTTDYSAQQLACSTAGGAWDSSSNYCAMPTTSSSQTSGSACGSGTYWNGSACVSSSQTQTSTTDYSSAQSACASAGGTWDSSSNYCRMPTSSAGSPTLAFACPQGHAWDGSHCTLTELSVVERYVAGVVSAFRSLFGL